MSGRKHHYLPRFLQRPFSHSRGGNGEFVHVHKKDRSFVSNLSGVGSERDFYGDQKDTSLDDAITRGERTLAAVLQQLNGDTSLSVPADDVALLVCAISIRTKAMRQALADIVPLVVAAARTRLDQPNSVRQMLLDQADDARLLESVNEVVDEQLRKLPPMPRAVSDQFRRQAIALVRKELTTPSTATITQMQSFMHALLNEVSSRATSIANGAYLDALRRDPHMPMRVESLRSFHRKFIERNEREDFVLGDCGAIAIFSDGIHRLPLGAVDKGVRPEVFLMPVSPDRCIALCRHANTDLPEVDSVNRMVCSLSNEFFVSRSADFEKLTGLRSLLNSATPFETEAAIRAHLLDGTKQLQHDSP